MTLTAARWKKESVGKSPFKETRCSTGTILENAIDTNTLIRTGRHAFVSHDLKKGVITPTLPTMDVKIIYLDLADD